jgi:tetratricopeptide (TPR) repeat protein
MFPMRRAIPIFAAACLLSVLAAPAAQAESGPNADICASTDDSAYAPTQRIAACGTLIDTLKDQPQVQAAALVNRGATYWSIDETQAAIADFDRAIALDPNNARAFRERSNAYRSIGQLDKALVDANDAVRLDPNDAQAFDYRGNVFNNNEQYDRAIADYNEAIRLKPQANFLTDRGDSYHFKGDYDRAIADYDRALALNPGFYLAYNNRGATYAKKGNLDHAIADYEEALRIKPDLDTAAEGLAESRQERDQRNADNSDKLLPSFDCGMARRAVEKAICSDPDLARLDREIDAAYKAALAGRNGGAARQLRQEQRDFLATRNTSFGNPQYNFKHEMELRLAALRGMSAKALP